MKLKQIMTIGLSTAMILSAVPGETVVFADAEQEAAVEMSDEGADAEITEDVTDADVEGDVDIEIDDS